MTVIQTLRLESGLPGYLEACARAANRAAHTLNGNIFPAMMADVDQSPSFISLLHTPSTREVLLPGALDRLVPTTTNNQYLDTSNYSCGLIADAVDESGKLVPNNYVNYPSSGIQLISALAYSEVMTPDKCFQDPMVEILLRKMGVQVLNVRTHAYLGKPLVATTLSKRIKDHHLKYRDFDTTPGGFGLADAADINWSFFTTGLSFEKPVTALLMLQSAIAYSNKEAVPDCVFISNSDMTKIGSPNNISFTWYDNRDVCFSPAAIQDKAGFVFPFSNTPGTLRFHLSLRTVPTKSNVIFVPSNIFSHTEDPAKCLAIWLMAIAEWPCFFASYKTCANTDTETLVKDVWFTPPEGPPGKGWWPFFPKGTDKDYATSQFLLNHSTVYIPGLKDMDVVLPRRYCTPTPSSASQAATSAILSPRVGPYGPGAFLTPLPPNSAILYNYIGGPDQCIPLCDYLVSWLPSLSMNDVNNVLYRVSMVYDLSSTRMAAWDLHVSLTQRFPPLLVGQKTPPTTIPGPFHDPTSTDIQDELTSAAVSVDETEDATISHILTAPLHKVTFKDVSSRIYEFVDIIHTDGGSLYTPMLTKCSGTLLHWRESTDGTFYPPFQLMHHTANFAVYDFSLTEWNKLALNLSTGDLLMGGNSTQFNQLVSSTTCLMEMKRAILLATPVQTVVNFFGFNNDPYAGDQNQVQFPAARGTIDMLFLRQASVLMPAKLEPNLQSLFTAMFGASLPQVCWHTGDQSVLTTVYGRWYRSDMASVFSDNRWQTTPVATTPVGNTMTRMRLYSPTILADIWTQIFARQMCKAQMAMPLFGMDGPAGYYVGMLSQITGVDGYRTPYLDRDLLLPYQSTNKMQMESDEAKWNVKLFVKSLLPDVKWVFITGPLPHDAYVQGLLPTQVETGFPPWGQKLKELYTSTHCFPHVWSDGMRVYPVARTNIMTCVQRAQKRTTRLQLSTWVIASGLLNNPVLADLTSPNDFYSSFLR